MGGLSTPEQLWRSRVDLLAQDLKRLDHCRQHILAPINPLFDKRLEQLLRGLRSALEKVRCVSPATSTAWNELQSLTHACQSLCELTLALLGGTAIGEHGLSQPGQRHTLYIKAAQDWLEQLCSSSMANLERELIVVSAHGQLFDPALGVVRVPFIDSQEWSLPLLARAVGLLATDPASYDHFKLLSQAIQQIVVHEHLLLSTTPLDLRMLPQNLQMAAESIRRESSLVAADEQSSFRLRHEQRLKVIDQAQHAYASAICADMFATALVGPAYAFANFTLDFNYSTLGDSPTQKDMAELVETAGVLSPIDRASAIIATLQLMDQDAGGCYQDAIAQLHAIWQESLDAASHSNSMPMRLDLQAHWHKQLYEHGIKPLLDTRIRDTANEWRQADSWHKSWCGRGVAPDKPLNIAVRLNLSWRCLLNHPKLWASLDGELGELAQERKMHRSPVPSATPGQAAAILRLARLQARCSDLINLIAAEGDQVQLSVAGRFNRRLSQLKADINRTTGKKITWSALHDLEKVDSSIRQEALDFFASLLILQQKLDVESAGALNGEDGPSVCSLADAMLRRWSQRTGANWSARTILGREPFLEPSTGLVRLRFPDWSIWNLPVMAHEFGHIVALDTVEFLKFHDSKVRYVDGARPEALSVYAGSDATKWLSNRSYHLHELFADIFAVVVAGPAFVCSAVLQQFNPADAYVDRGTHPSHDERVKVMLDILGRLNQVAQRDPYDKGPYAEIIERLAGIWDSAVTNAAASAGPDAAYRKQTLDWGKQIYRSIIAPIYSLGAGYNATRWHFAKELAKRLMSDSRPTAAERHQLARHCGLQHDNLEDFLNALWCARCMLVKNDNDQLWLNSIGFSLAKEFEDTKYE
jgi:hypothetical protein